jgi:hypothetical protein
MRPLLSPRRGGPCCLCPALLTSPVAPVAPVAVPSLVSSSWLLSLVSLSAFHRQPGHRCPSSVHVPDAVCSTSLLSPLLSIVPVVHPASSRSQRRGMGASSMGLGGWCPRGDGWWCGVRHHRVPLPRPRRNCPVSLVVPVVFVLVHPCYPSHPMSSSSWQWCRAGVGVFHRYSNSKS